MTQTDLNIVLANSYLNFTNTGTSGIYIDNSDINNLNIVDLNVLFNAGRLENPDTPGSFVVLSDNTDVNYINFLSSVNLLFTKGSLVYLNSLADDEINFNFYGADVNFYNSILEDNAIGFYFYGGEIETINISGLNVTEYNSLNSGFFLMRDDADLGIINVMNSNFNVTNSTSSLFKAESTVDTDSFALNMGGDGNISIVDGNFAIFEDSDYNSFEIRNTVGDINAGGFLTLVGESDLNYITILDNELTLYNSAAFVSYFDYDMASSDFSLMNLDLNTEEVIFKAVDSNIKNFTVRDANLGNLTFDFSDADVIVEDENVLDEDLNTGLQITNCNVSNLNVYVGSVDFNSEDEFLEINDSNLINVNFNIAAANLYGGSLIALKNLNLSELAFYFNDGDFNFVTGNTNDFMAVYDSNVGDLGLNNFAISNFDTNGAIVYVYGLSDLNTVDINTSSLITLPNYSSLILYYSTADNDVNFLLNYSDFNFIDHSSGFYFGDNSFVDGIIIADLNIAGFSSDQGVINLSGSGTNPKDLNSLEITWQDGAEITGEGANVVWAAGYVEDNDLELNFNSVPISVTSTTGNAIFFADSALGNLEITNLYVANCETVFLTADWTDDVNSNIESLTIADSNLTFNSLFDLNTQIESGLFYNNYLIDKNLDNNNIILEDGIVDENFGMDFNTAVGSSVSIRGIVLSDDSAYYGGNYWLDENGAEICTTDSTEPKGICDSGYEVNPDSNVWIDYLPLVYYGAPVTTGNSPGGGGGSSSSDEEEVTDANLDTNTVITETIPEKKAPIKKEVKTVEDTGKYTAVLDSNISVGDTQTIYVTNSFGTPVVNLKVTIVYPGEEEKDYNTDEKGTISFVVEQAGKYTVTLMQKDGTELETEFFAYSTKLPELPKEPESNNSILIIIAGVLIGIIVIVGGYFLLKKKQKQLKAKV